MTKPLAFLFLAASLIGGAAFGGVPEKKQKNPGRLACSAGNPASGAAAIAIDEEGGPNQHADKSKPKGRTLGGEDCDGTEGETVGVIIAGYEGVTSDGRHLYRIAPQAAGAASDGSLLAVTCRRGKIAAVALDSADRAAARGKVIRVVKEIKHRQAHVGGHVTWETNQPVARTASAPDAPIRWKAPELNRSSRLCP